MNLFRTKPVQAVMDADAAQPGEVTLKRVLTARHLVLLGIGAVIGAGSVMVHSVPAHAVAAGVPGRLLRLRGHASAEKKGRGES